MRYIRLSAVLVLLACGDGGTTPTSPPTPVATSITLSATTLSFASLGQTQQLSATVKDQNGATMSGTGVSWSSSSASVATVSSSGLVTSVADGTATITATSGSATANASASIQQVAVSITLSPDSLVFITPGDTTTVTATVKDAGGSEIPSPSLTWSSSDTTTVTVNSSGLVTAVASGPASVTAKTGDQEAEIDTRVKGSFLAVTVTGDGAPLPDVTVWLTDPTGESIKQVTDSVGKTLFRSLQPGEHTVTLQQVPTGLTLTPTSPQTIQISEDQEHDFLFTGIFAPAQVTGTAKSWGKPVEGAVVRVEGKDTVEVTVNSVGVFQVDSVRRGDYTLTISNHTGVRFKDTTLTQTLQSGANSAEFIGKPDPEPTWASVNADGSGTNSNAGSACGLTTAGEVYCWGANYNGQLGDGTTTDRHQPTIVSGSHDWAAVTAGRYHTCGLTKTGEAYCWGANNFGQLGNGRPGTQHASPALVSGGHTWASVTAGYDHTCGMTIVGKAYCWGYNGYGALGDGELISQSIPVPVKGAYKWRSLDVGGSHSCGLTTEDEVYCWGFNNFGQLGNGMSETSTIPVLVTGQYKWASVTGGYYHVCGLTTTGEAYCWGYNTSGQLGDTTTTTRRQPVLVGGGHTWLSLNGGYYHSCGLTTAEEVYCWGRNKYGGLGDGTFTSRSTPNPVSGGYNWTLVDAAGSSSCGAEKTGGLYCWGRNDYGGLGDGTTTNSTTPVRVGGNW